MAIVQQDKLGFADDFGADEEDIYVVGAGCEMHPKFCNSR